jgi:hypothetical protein
MKVTVKQLRELLVKSFSELAEDVDRERRHKYGYALEDDGTAVSYGDLPEALELEDEDRLRRHADAYGDEMEEAGTCEKKAKSHAPPLQGEDPFPGPPVGEASEASMGSDISREKAKKMLKHGHVHGKPLTKGQKGLLGLVARPAAPTKTEVKMPNLRNLFIKLKQ